MTFKGICIVEVSGQSCASCLSLMNELKNVDLPKDVNLIHIEIDEDQKEFINQYQIDRLPTILILKDDVEISRCRGFQPEEILSLWLNSKILEARGKE